VAIALILGSIVFLFFYDEESYIKEKIKNLIDIKEEIPGQETPIPTKIKEEDESENNSLEVGDGGPDLITLGEESCPTKQVAYSLQNFSKSFECLNYNIDGDCTDLIANCLIEIHNLNSGNSTGEFKLRYNIESNIGDVWGTESFSEVIPSNEFRLFNPSFTFGHPEGLPESLDCKLKVDSVPKKEVC
jgi:hypothetical protein